MGILDTVDYLNKHPLTVDKGRHGTPTQEAQALEQMSNEFLKDHVEKEFYGINRNKG